MAESTKKSSTKSAADKATATVKDQAAKAKAQGKKAKAEGQKATGAATAKATQVTPKSARDAVNTVVGFGVLGVNKAQSTARDLAKTVKLDEVTSRVSKVADQAADATKSQRKAATGAIAKIDERIEDVIHRAEAVVESYEEKLPSQIAEISRKARETGAKVREQVRSRVLSA